MQKISKHDAKRERVAERLNLGQAVTQISRELNIPLGSMTYLLERWNLLDQQLHQKGIHFTKDGGNSVSRQLKARHAETGYMLGDKHWSHGRLRLRGEWVSHDEAKLALAELVEQDMTIAQIAEECGTDYKTITNWLTRFDMHKGIRSGSRCSWFKGGHQKYRGPGWLTLRKDILERDGYKCRVCNETQDEAREKGHPLNVHHIVPWEVSQDNSPDNLITLCQPCHMREEWSNGRHSNGNNNLTQ